MIYGGFITFMLKYTILQIIKNYSCNTNKFFLIFNPNEKALPQYVNISKIITRW